MGEVVEASRCSSAPFIGGRGGGGEGAAVAARQTPRPALMAVGAGSALGVNGGRGSSSEAT